MRIEKLAINDVSVDPSNMVVIVGSNGTGKTRLIEELHYSITKRVNGDPTSFWKIEFVPGLAPNDIKKWIGHLTAHVSESTPVWSSPFTTWHNQADGINLNDTAYQQFKDSDGSQLLNVYGLEFIKEFVNYLQVANRIGPQSIAQIGPANQKATDVPNLLYSNENISKEIESELKKLFGKKLIIAPHNFPNLELRIVDDDIENPEEFNLKDRNASLRKYLEWKKKNRVVDMWMEGHGIQAFLQIMLTYCIPLNDVLLIDEPEIHLYPSIKRKFGNTLGEMSKKGQKQFICVTHDSDFLQGVFDSKCNLDVIKITKKGKKRDVIHKFFDKTTSYLASQSQTPFLQIPFLDAAIVVEGATDRIVYESVFFDNNFLSEVEYKFISAGGKDSIRNPIRVARDLKVPHAVILDIENLKEKDNSHLIKLLGDLNANDLAQAIHNLGPKLKGIDNFVVTGIGAIKDAAIASEVLNVVNKLKALGIFIVQKGTLESWTPVRVEKTNSFPEFFLADYYKQKEKYKEMISFLNEIEKYLKGLTFTV